MTMLMYGALLGVGVMLLLVTMVRVLVGGIAGSSDRTAIAPPAATGSARRILDERYAAGELSTEDYQRRRRVLEQED